MDSPPHSPTPSPVERCSAAVVSGLTGLRSDSRHSDSRSSGGLTTRGSGLCPHSPLPNVQPAVHFGEGEGKWRLFLSQRTVYDFVFCLLFTVG